MKYKLRPLVYEIAMYGNSLSFRKSLSGFAIDWDGPAQLCVRQLPNGWWTVDEYTTGCSVIEDKNETGAVHAAFGKVLFAENFPGLLEKAHQQNRDAGFYKVAP